MKKKTSIILFVLLSLLLSACTKNNTAGIPFSSANSTQTSAPTLFRTPEPTSTPLPTKTPAKLSGYAQELLDYFMAIALSSEYGSNHEGAVIRWEGLITLEVSGKPTQKDMQTLTDFADILNDVSPNLRIAITEKAGTGNFVFYFVPLRDMKKAIPTYVEGNWGYVYLTWDSAYRIDKASAAIATDVTNQQQRNHLIMEEFAQGLGLLNDSLKYPESIFYGKWTEVQKPADIDYYVIAMLYSNAIHAGQTLDEAKSALTELLISNPPKK